MQQRIKTFFIVTVLIFGNWTTAQGQIGFGFVLGGDWYQWYRNPDATGDPSLPSAGNAVLNSVFGPKIWIGKRNFSISAEGHVNWGITNFDLQEYKGMGAIAFPLLAKFNFGALSGFSEGKVTGLSIGGGVQYTRTELYGLSADFRGITTRDFFRTYIGEVAFGFGFGGAVSTLFVRYGIGEDNSRTLNVGSMLELNFLGFKKFFEENRKKNREQTTTNF